MKKVMLVAVLLGFAQSDAMLSNIARTGVSSNVSLSRLFANAVQNETKQTTNAVWNKNNRYVTIELDEKMLREINKTIESLKSPIVMPDEVTKSSMGLTLIGKLIQTTFLCMLAYRAGTSKK